MYLRMFCSIDESPIGRLALSYMPALVRVAPVRIVDPDRMGMPELPGGWGRYHRALETPMQGPFVNIVCTRPERWTWIMKIEAAIENSTDPETPTELIEERRELYTAGVRNTLITDLDATAFSKLEKPLRDSAFKYDTILGAADPDFRKDPAAFRRIILGDARA